MNDKAEFNKHFAPLVHRKWLYSKTMDFADFKQLAEISPILIIKPEDGVEGRGVYQLKVDSTEEIHLKEVFDDLKQQNVLIEQRIVQHEYMTLGSKSVNTIRVHTLLDRQGNVHIFKCCLRAGVGDTVVDNYCAGGCVYEVDSETGIVVSKSLNKDHIEYMYHPGTNICMLGFQVPNWNKVVEGVTEAAKLLPQCRIIGWDVAVTPEGIDLIEGNHNPDYELIEFFGTNKWYAKLKPYL